jgi:hypothetical protein
MTRQKAFKDRVRTRMTKTGESYTAARRMLISFPSLTPPTPEPEAPASPSVVSAFRPERSDAKLIASTGHSWDQWLERIDQWGGAEHNHTEIARWLREEYGISGWWAQWVTVAYEQARGMREPGQHADGFSVGASKTIAAPVEAVFEAFEDAGIREQWLPGAELHPRTATPPKSARYDWQGGPSRVVVLVEALQDSRSRISIQHEKLPDAASGEQMKAYWRARVNALKSLLEAR